MTRRERLRRRKKVDPVAFLDAVMAQALRPVKLAESKAVSWTTPHQGEQEKARRVRQIAKGMRVAS